MKYLTQMNKQNTGIPYWIEMIRDLVDGVGYSYSRIAYRINVSSSAIQKLATNPNRTPRDSVLIALMHLHQKVFCSEFSTPKAKAYWVSKSLMTL